MQSLREQGAGLAEELDSFRRQVHESRTERIAEQLGLKQSINEDVAALRDSLSAATNQAAEATRTLRLELEAALEDARRRDNRTMTVAAVAALLAFILIGIQVAL